MVTEKSPVEVHRDLQSATRKKKRRRQERLLARGHFTFEAVARRRHRRLPNLRCCVSCGARQPRRLRSLPGLKDLAGADLTIY